MAASLVKADLQGASIEHTEMQDAKIEGALIWRLDARNAKAAGARLVDPQPAQAYSSDEEEESECRETSCKWTVERFARFRRTIETEVPDGERRRQALERIATLDPAAAPAEPGVAESWTRLEETVAREEAASDGRLTAALHALACRGRDAPYVLEGLLHQIDFRFEKGAPAATALANTFLAEDCKSTTQLLRPDQLDMLRQIRDRAPPEPPPAPPRDVPKRNQPTN